VAALDPHLPLDHQNGQGSELIAGPERERFLSLREIVRATSRQSAASVSLLASSARWQAAA
jgi:hypothetical protein